MTMAPLLQLWNFMIYECVLADISLWGCGTFLGSWRLFFDFFYFYCESGATEIVALFVAVAVPLVRVRSAGLGQRSWPFDKWVLQFSNGQALARVELWVMSDVRMKGYEDATMTSFAPASICQSTANWCDDCGRSVVLSVCRPVVLSVVQQQMCIKSHQFSNAPFKCNSNNKCN